VLSGNPDAPETRALLRTAHRVFQPHKVVLGTAGPVEAFARTLQPKDSAATAYVCVGTSCLPPINDPGKLRESLQAKRGD
jgi:uncharacterized protein YyaL (SSP411 family)